MSSDVHTAHECACDNPKLGIVDGDAGAIFCGNCDGVLGSIEDADIITRELCEHENVEEEVMTFAKLSWWADAHTYVPDDSEDETVNRCIDCKAWSHQYESEWHYDD